MYKAKVQVFCAGLLRDTFLSYNNNFAFVAISAIEPFDLIVEEMFFGRDYRLTIGHDQDFPKGADVEVYLKGDGVSEFLLDTRFEAQDWYNFQYGSYAYAATVEFEAILFLDPGEYYFEAIVNLDGGGLLTSDPSTFTFDYDKIDIALPSVTIADPVVQADGDAWFALNFENNSTLDQISDYGVAASIRSITDGVNFQAFDLIEVDNISPGSSGREIVRLKLNDLDERLDPGTYEVRFSILPLDEINEPEWDLLDNVASTNVYILPQNTDAMPRESGDFNGDRVEDVLFYNADTRGVGQFGMPTGEWSSLGRAGVGWVAKGTGHFDSDDSAADVLWFNEITRNVGRFDLSEGGSSWGGLGKAGIGWEVAGAGDFNGDGTDDILWLNTVTNAVGQFRVNEGVSSWSGIGRSGSVWEFSGVGDFNGDGVDDLLWYNTATGALGQFEMSASGMSWAFTTTLGQGYQAVATGDFNGDGSDDILVYREASGDIGYFQMDDGVATWVGAAATTLAEGYSVEGTGDFDGDGKDDIMLRHTDGAVVRLSVENGIYGLDEVGTAGSDWDVIL